MKPTSVLFVETEKWEEEYLRRNLPDRTLVFSEGRLEEALQSADQATTVLSNFIYSPVGDAELKRLPNLEFVAARSTGFDHIDLVACKRAGVEVANVPVYGENTVAEHTFALLLGISRKIPESLRRTREGRFTPEDLRGFDLRGRTIGVIGVGSIGRHVVRIARALDMRVIAYQRHPDEELAKKLGFQFVPLPDLLRQSDIVTLHIPENEETHHFINEHALAEMKDGVVLLNTSRGGLIDTKALVKALDSGKVAAAGLDVLEEEGLIKEERQLLSKHYDPGQLKKALEGHILLSHPNVLVTPHNAFNSKEALRRILDTTIDNIGAFLSGKPINLVSK